ncbi:CAP domain-containing protein [Methanobrevibacter filiformis]|uniref:Cysteine-rich secretory protein family protein n=1 Tax=Methanobrevibacter filiformis TaxID=55758 RepID=A0A166CWU9_9EURY|nr:CAP domain-containing protein [Methanobrevibacter filiformis]KZX14949.1 cysteine-rich secretory protein family protein [Methanobrevibacter filiformis]
MNFKYFKLFIILFVVVGSTLTLSNHINYSTSAEKMAEGVLFYMNEERAKLDLNPVTMDPILHNVSFIRANEIMIDFSHTRPNGLPWFTVSPYTYGENLAIGQSSPAQVVKEWMDSPTHRANILEYRFKSVGIAFIKRDNGSYYWVQEFGVDNTTIKLKNLKTSSSSKNLSFKWGDDLPFFVSGYEIYKYDSKTKKYNYLKKLIGSINNKFTDYNVSSGTTYKYYVRLYKTVNGSNTYGSFNKVNVTTKPNKTSISLKQSRKKIVVKWNKVPRASGYELYRSVGSSKNFKLKKSFSSKVYSFTDKKLSYKYKYYYKIKSYVKVNGKKVYSTFSSVKYKKPIM